ncbi:MAG TPA: deoxyribose-phosphate aldolase [Anaerolineae bacterium]|jgi:deoxyribose-phosphate aldolase
MELNRYIDHTLLKPDASRAQIDKLCAEALQYHFASVCVNLCWTRVAAEQLEKSDVKVCTVVGFPLGATTTLAKMFESDQAIEAGAREIDMVINIGAVKSNLMDFVTSDISGVLDSCHRNRRKQALLKVIIEAVLLTDDEKRAVCEIAKKVGADFVKTSTGFALGGATIADVKLMRATVGPEMGVKAAGGIRTKADALAMIEAGATRLGTSAGIAIMTTEAPAASAY